MSLHTHIHTAETHISGIASRKKTSARQEMRANASNKQATTVLRITKFDFLEEKLTNHMNRKKNLLLSQYKYVFFYPLVYRFQEKNHFILNIMYFLKTLFKNKKWEKMDDYFTLFSMTVTRCCRLFN